MKRSSTPRTSLAHSSYAQYAHGQTYIAMPFSADITVDGLGNRPYGHSLPHQIRQSIDSIAYDVLTQGTATRLFCLSDTRDCDYPYFHIIDSSRQEKFEKPSIVSKKIIVKSGEFGIKKRRIKGMVRKLSHSQMPRIDNDFVRRSNLCDMMADRAGRVVFWTLTDSSKFTDPCILIKHCNQIILAIKICKFVETAINSFLAEAEIEAKVTVPTYSLADLLNSLEAFEKGNISVEDFSDVVFRQNF